ncbi:hypothetical protein FRC07_010899 [Ceratobasidium sp. 392]|nr:hypothetical protein FRC07_010899 [Ceratobasidium sp. 392]
MSFDERHAQIAYPDDAPHVLYTEPQSLEPQLYGAPAYTSDDQWAPSMADQYAPGLYKVPALADSRPRAIQSEWSDVGPFTLPPYPQQPPAYIPQQQQMYRMYPEMPPPLAPGLDDSYDAPVKAEPVVVPTQSPYYSRPSSVASSLASAPHHIVHVVFTDDAASKETQYLRRRCHNCQQVEPPSWRRSHLVPGKIVCNRCGLYERTHLRPRPHRFDEVRTGNKGRKAKSSGSRQGSPQPPAVTQFTVKQEFVPEVDFDSRRGSVASSFSSASSHSAEWSEDTGANYTTSVLGAGTPLRLSPSQQHATAHIMESNGGVQRGVAHLGDAALAARFRAGRKSATAPYDAFNSVARMGPPTPPLVPGVEPTGMPMPDAFSTTPPVRRHTLGTDVSDISWSTLPAEFALQNTQQPIAY